MSQAGPSSSSLATLHFSKKCGFTKKLKEAKCEDTVTERGLSQMAVGANIAPITCLSANSRQSFPEPSQ